MSLVRTRFRLRPVRGDLSKPSHRFHRSDRRVLFGYFLASLIYELLVQSPSRSSVLAIIVWLWVLGDLAIVLCAWAIRTIPKARSSAVAKLVPTSPKVPQDDAQIRRPETPSDRNGHPPTNEGVESRVMVVEQEDDA